MSEETFQYDRISVKVSSNSSESLTPLTGTEYFILKFGFDAAKKEPFKFSRKQGVEWAVSEGYVMIHLVMTECGGSSKYARLSKANIFRSHGWVRK